MIYIQFTPLPVYRFTGIPKYRKDIGTPAFYAGLKYIKNFYTVGNPCSDFEKK